MSRETNENKLNGISHTNDRKRTRRLRYATVLLVLAVYIIGVLLYSGLGSLCAFGVSNIAAICPVGILETAIAGHMVGVLPVIVLIIIIILAVFFGRAFCGWICPVPLTRKLITGKGEKDAWEADRKKANCTSCASCSNTDCAKVDLVEKQDKKFKIAPLSRNSKSALGVLGVTLITTLIFGFPIFCLLCPVGLVFATIFAVIRLITYNELVIDLLVFPALIVIELILLRHWCSSFCPIGAFLGLFSRFGRTFRPTVDPEKCLVTTQDSSCDACHAACPHDIDLVRATGTGNIADCSRCGECSAHCPTQAISFPATPKVADNSDSNDIPLQPETPASTSN